MNGIIKQEERWYDESWKFNETKGKQNMKNLYENERYIETSCKVQ